MTRNQDCGCAEHASHDGCLPGCFDYACRRWNESPAGRPLQTIPPAIAYTNVTADDWVTTDQDAAALQDLIAQRAEDDNETGADGGEL
jgi:hypothetical protein